MSNLDRKLNSQFYRAYINLDDYEDLREAYDRLLTKMVRLVEAAKEGLELLQTTTACFGLGACRYHHSNCIYQDAECCIISNLKAALEEDG